MDRSRPFRDVASPDEPALQPIADGRTCIAVIGIDRYREWNRLGNAVSDALGALKLFKELGFEQACLPVLDEAATGDALRRLVSDDLATLGPDDSLVLFFAGHGHTVTRTYPGETNVKTGYIVPVDGDLPGGRTGTWLRLDSWLSDAARLPVRHLLVVLDACHSGIALNQVVQWRGNEIAGIGPLDQLRTRRSRRIITSALDDQLALDSGPIPGHSLFTGCLIEALTGGLVARTNDSLVTGTEIGRYVQRRVINYPSSKQTPDFGALELDARGELLVRLPMSSVVEAPSGATLPAAAQAAPVVRPEIVHLAQLPESAISPAALLDANDASPGLDELMPSPEATPVRPVRDRATGGALRRIAGIVAVVATLVMVAVVVSQIRSAPRARTAAVPGAASDAPREASLDAPRDASPDAPLDAATDTPALAATIAKLNPFLPLGALQVQAHQVTRDEYATYLATLPATLQGQAAPLEQWSETPPDEPVRWTRFEQATAFCEAIDARLPTFDEWQRASGGKWGLDPAGSNHLGPLREWTSDRAGGFVRVAGGTAAMSVRQRAEAHSERFQLATAASFVGNAVPDTSDVSSKEVGIRCVK
jgi:hypothetical protein